ncbi:MAG: hypothetical protein ACTSUE_25515 [Promethearchaeota archaeon]
MGVISLATSQPAKAANQPTHNRPVGTLVGTSFEIAFETTFGTAW